MGKRKHSPHDESDYRSIKKKMKKLERKLKKYIRPSYSSSSDTDYSCPKNSSYPEANYEDEYDEMNNDDYQDVQDVDSPQEQVDLSQNDTILETNKTIEEPRTAQEKSEEVLDPDILTILGEDPSIQTEYGENLHKDIAPRWSHILINGLSKETKSDLVKRYLPAENCINMKAPKLNLEIEAALTPINVKKDTFSQSKQNQLASCLSAIGVALNWALSSSKDSLPQAQQIIKPLSDAGRLLCDSYYRESQSRRYAIINTLNKKTQDAVRNTKLDGFLFGTNLSEHLKSTKAISQSGAEMKFSSVQRAPFKPHPASRKNQRGALNLRGMPRPAAGEPRQNPSSRRPAPAPRDRRDHSRRSYSTRHRTTRR